MRSEYLYGAQSTLICKLTMLFRLVFNAVVFNVVASPAFVFLPIE